MLLAVSKCLPWTEAALICPSFSAALGFLTCMGSVSLAYCSDTVEGSWEKISEIVPGTQMCGFDLEALRD